MMLLIMCYISRCVMVFVASRMCGSVWRSADSVELFKYTLVPGMAGELGVPHRGSEKQVNKKRSTPGKFQANGSKMESPNHKVGCIDKVSLSLFR